MPVRTLLAILLVAPRLLAAQHTHTERSLALGGEAIGLVRRVDPAFDGRAFTEGYLARPILMLHATSGAHLSAAVTMNLEGLTLERGELDPGIWGEGYIDRRHPHTYLHEAIATAGATVRGSALSLSGGKGFAPFGTDDPMMRPFVAYPANHHLSQILERAVLVAAIRRGPLALEGGLFNGDEPEGPGDAPNSRRFADSWSLRATLAPRRWMELQASHATVQSSEWARGFGSDQRKRSAAIRLEHTPWRVSDLLPPTGCASTDGTMDDREYAMIEWARTDDIVGGQPTFRFQSVLAEGSVRRRGIELGLRWELTERPEEERLLNPFRSARPHTDESILGVTRWRIATAAVSAPLSLPAGVHRLAAARPFLEVARIAGASVSRPAVFDPSAFFGDDVLWSLSAGVRVSAGALHRRMGRYGAALVGPLVHDHLR